jgi:cell division control protein 6
MLLTKKVTALTGDVRSLFEVLRVAIDLAVAQVKKPSEDDNHLNIPPMTVTPQHVRVALEAYTPVSATPTASLPPHPHPKAIVKPSRKSAT